MKSNYFSKKNNESLFLSQNKSIIQLFKKINDS